MLHGKKVRPTTITIVVIVLSLFLLNYFVFNTSSVSFDFNSKIEGLAKEMNKMTPVEYDEETRLDSVKAPCSSTLVYYITCIKRKKTDFNVDSFKVAKRPEIIDGLRILPNIKLFIDNDVTLITNYRDAEGKFLAEITVSPEDYNGKNKRRAD